MVVQYIVYLGVPLIFLAVVFTIVAYLSYVERKMGAFMQIRVGPNRAGPWGILQPIADAIKFLFKEDVIVDTKDKALYVFAPAIIFIATFVALAALPFGMSFSFMGINVEMNVVNISVGVLFVVAFSGIAVYGIVLGGWASGSKYPLLGAMRSAAQVLSYEVPLTLTIAIMVLTYNTFDLTKIADLQQGTLLGFLPRWGVFLQPVAFLVFIASAFAEANRIPFDLPEEESVLVSGYHTEYSSMKFAMLFMAEYGHMILASGLIVLFFLGGWHLPYINASSIVSAFAAIIPADWARLVTALLLFGVFFVKVCAVLFVYVWARWTFPRFRFDQLMSICWKVLVPVSMVDLVITAGVITWLYA